MPAAPPNWTASRPLPTSASRSRASSIAVSQPAATSPNVTGTACCSSVRPAITVPRVLGGPGRPPPPAAAARSPSMTRSARRASSMAAVSMMSWLVAPWCTARRRAPGSTWRAQRPDQRGHRVAGERRLAAELARRRSRRPAPPRSRPRRRRAGPARPAPARGPGRPRRPASPAATPRRRAQSRPGQTAPRTARPVLDLSRPHDAAHRQVSRPAGRAFPDAALLAVISTRRLLAVITAVSSREDRPQPLLRPDCSWVTRRVPPDIPPVVPNGTPTRPPRPPRPDRVWMSRCLPAEVGNGTSTRPTLLRSLEPRFLARDLRVSVTTGD